MASQVVQRSVNSVKALVIIAACITLLLWSSASFAGLAAFFDDQSPVNPVPEGIEISYTVLVENTDPTSGSLLLSVRIIVDGEVQRADAIPQVFSSPQCNRVDSAFPSDWICGNLADQTVLTFTWLQPDPGSNPIEFRFAGVDSSGSVFFSGTATETIVGNLPPVFTSLPDIQVNEGEEVSWGIFTSDPNGDAVFFEFTGLPDFCTNDISVTIVDVNCRPAIGDAGTYTVTVVATDNGTPSRSTTGTFVITVDALAPDLAPINDQTMREGDSLTIPLTATNPQDALLTLTGTGLPNFCSLTDNSDGTGSIICNPDQGNAGTYNVTVTVTDDGDLPQSDSESFVLTVEQFVSQPLTATLNDQQPANPVPIGTSVAYTITTTNNDPAGGTIGTGVFVYVDGVLQPANSGVFSADGCSVDPAFPSAWACNNLTAQVTQQIYTLIWLAPDAGTHNLRFEVIGQRPIDNIGPPDYSIDLQVQTTIGSNLPVVTVSGPSSVDDADGQPGEDVQVTGSALDAEDGTLPPTSFRWFVNGSEIAAAAGQATPTLRLPNDGDNTVELQATDSDNQSSRGSVTITVNPRVNAPAVGITATGSTGVAISVEDTDGLQGESIQVTGTATDPEDGDLPSDSFRWFVNGEEVTEAGGQATVTLPLPDGESTIEFEATDSDDNATRASVTVTVSEPDFVADDGPISGRPGLSPNETETAVGLETTCGNIIEVGNPTQEQQDLLALCGTLASDESSDADVAETLNAISGEQITSQKATSIDFASVQLSNVGSRIGALRTLGLRGSRGVSTAGLNLDISVDGKPVPVYAVAEVVKGLLRGGGASADEEQTDGQTDTSSSSILNPKLGIFINGNIAFGDKDQTTNETGFDFDSTGLTFGMDYLFTDHFVAGIALGYANAEAKFFGNTGEQSSDFYSGTLFGTIMHDKWFVAGIGGIANGDYDTIRRISGPLLPQDETASGTTDGNNLFGGLSAEFDFGRGPWRFGPAVAINYIEADIDGFAESGAGALDLVYGDQTAKSLTMKAGLRLGYVFTTGFGVLSLDGRGDFVREYENDSQIIRVNFVNDPFVNDPNMPSPGFTVLTDEPDKDYGLWGLSLSYQGPHSISGFVDYQSVTGMSGMTLSEITIGLRIQKQFD
jgi:uncharacterized protein with beta-barrel porin domain